MSSEQKEQEQHCILLGIFLCYQRKSTSFSVSVNDQLKGGCQGFQVLKRTSSLGECRACTGSRAEEHLAGGVQGPHRQQSRGPARWGSAGPAQAAEQLSEPQRQAAMKQDSLAGSAGKSPLASAGDKSQIAGLGRSSTPMHHGY